MYFKMFGQNIIKQIIVTYSAVAILPGHTTDASHACYSLIALQKLGANTDKWSAKGCTSLHTRVFLSKTLRIN